MTEVRERWAFRVGELAGAGSSADAVRYNERAGLAPPEPTAGGSHRGRYGSEDETANLSYTEMEYDFAVKQGKPVMAFVHADMSSPSVI